MAGLIVGISIINTVPQNLSPAALQWVFAYGSLVWRPGFEFRHSSLASLAGWRRAFSQASPDHRGTPESPGRVLTLRQDCQGVCEGIAYCVASERWSAVVDYLDIRESGGYSQQIVEIALATGQRVAALTYIALPENPHACEPEAKDKLVALIRSRHGPSGSNLDYVLKLAQALRTHGIRDHEVESLACDLRSGCENSR